MWSRATRDIACALDGDGILTITLNRPEKLNAFTVQMTNELVAAFGQANTDDAVRAIVVTGAGRAFCAGMDLTGEGRANVFGLDETLRPTGCAASTWRRSASRPKTNTCASSTGCPVAAMVSRRSTLPSRCSAWPWSSKGSRRGPRPGRRSRRAGGSLRQARDGVRERHGAGDAVRRAGMNAARPPEGAQPPPLAAGGGGAARAAGNPGGGS